MLSLESTNSSLPPHLSAYLRLQTSSNYGFREYAGFFNGNCNNKTPFYTKQPLNTPGGLGKEIKGDMQGTNILGRLETDYRGQMTDGKMFRDSRIETNIVGETSVERSLAGQNIHPGGGTGGDDITNTHEFLKDVDAHIIKLLTVKVKGDNPEQITFHVILGSNAPPILVHITAKQNIHNIGGHKQRVH